MGVHHRPLLGAALCCVAFGASAATYDLPPPGNDLIGGETWVTAAHEDTLLDLSQKHGVGYDEIRQANPNVDPWIPGAGTAVLLPTRYVLPKPRRGLVINLAERRLYYFPKSSGKVITYPVSIGRDGLDTPTVTTKVLDKVRNPAWYPGPAAQQDRIDDGLPRWPNVVPPGPENPLGPLAIILDIPEIMIHGTNRPNGIGMPVTHGCIRMAQPDLKHLVRVLPRGTPVRVINRRYKVGWQNGVLYLEAHRPPMDALESPDLGDVEQSLAEAWREQPEYEVDWAVAGELLMGTPGTPRPLWPRAAAQPDV